MNMRSLPFLLLAGLVLALITSVEADEGPGPQVAVAGNYAYDSNGYNQIGVAVADGYAYVFSSNQLVVVNVSDPTNPTYESNYQSFDLIYDVVVVDNYAYVAAGGNGLVVVNVSDPTNPTEVGHYYDGSAMVDVAVADGYAYVAANSNGLVVVDVSDPTNPTEVGHYYDYDYVQGVVVVDNYAYIYAHYDEFVMVDVSDPSNPLRLVGNYHTSDQIYDLVVVDNYAYVITSDGLVVVDVSGGPANITYVGSHYDNYNTDGYARGVVVSDGYAYIVYCCSGELTFDPDGDMYTWKGKDGLAVINVIDPMNPIRTGGYDTSISVYGYEPGIDEYEAVYYGRSVAVADGYGYFIDWWGELVVVGPDGDGDGMPDVSDLFLSDPNEWADADSDGVGDNGDAFPSDPAASVDSDDDGFPDEWNAGKSQVDSITGLYLDTFPSDPEEWADGDGDGMGDNGDTFPSDPDEWTDTDGDGIGDNSDAFPKTTWLNAWWQVLLSGIIIASGATANYRYSQYKITRRVSDKADEVRAKIAEFKEKGINTDELEKVLAKSEE